MKRTALFLATVLTSVSLFAQQGGVEVDYNRPRKYTVGGIAVEGNNYFSSSQIISLTGLEEGMEVTIPSEELSGIVKRLWLQRFFEDVSLDIDHVNAAGDSVWLAVKIIERPRVSRWTFSGVKSGEEKDLKDRLNLRRGGEFSEYVEKTSTDIIKRFYAEKGFLNCKVEAEVKQDSVIRNAIRVNFAVDRGEKVKVREINFIGGDDIREYKLAKSMKKTKSRKWYNFFHSKKFDPKEYPNDKKTLLEAFNEAGYRDARIVKDSIYYIEPGRLGIDITVEEGDKYYFRDVSWTGNSVFTTEALNSVLGVSKGDIYDVVSMEKRLYGGGKQTEMDVAKLYRDNGYLFFNVTPVETNIQNDSVDIEMRISEGKQATLNNIVINGNDLTNEKVVRRQIFTRPGNLFSQTDFERSIREIASLGQFDAEAIQDPSSWSIVPNNINNTVDIVYNVTEKPSSQLELSGGWGGRTFVATAGVSFNNFSTHRMFEKGAWRPVPLGDAQNLSFHFQTNGSYYTAVNASFTEPWLFGNKPTALNLGAYYTRQTASNSGGYYNYFYNYTVDRILEIYGFSASLGTRLKWPDNYFVLYNGLSWQSYKLTNWYQGYFFFQDGLSHNLSWQTTLARNSTDQQIYPRMGSDFSVNLQLTPPYSLFRRYTYDSAGNKVRVGSWRDVDYNATDASGNMLWSSGDRYRWIEYWKVKGNFANYTKLFADLVLMTRVQFGYLGYYNRSWGYSPFEGFLVGGDGMSGYSTYGSDIIPLRGYPNYSLTPYTTTAYNSNGSAYSGNVYDKFTVEFRYPVILQPSSTIFVLAFMEGGNCWSDIRDFNPFQIKRSAGVGVRIFLPMIGLLGIDWGYGFDNTSKSDRSQFHFIIGQQF